MDAAPPHRIENRIPIEWTSFATASVLVHIVYAGWKITARTALPPTFLLAFIILLRGLEFLNPHTNQTYLQLTNPHFAAEASLMQQMKTVIWSNIRMVGPASLHLFFLFVVIGLFMLLPLGHSHDKEARKTNWCFMMFRASAIVSVCLIFSFLVFLSQILGILPTSVSGGRVLVLCILSTPFCAVACLVVDIVLYFLAPERNANLNRKTQEALKEFLQI